LPPAPTSGPEPIQIIFGVVEASPSLTWSTLWQVSQQEPWALVAREPGAYHVRVTGYAHFKVTATAIEIAAEPGVRASTIRHLLLDQVLPLALAHEGRLVLHASGLRRGDDAIAIAGAAGSGKSTMAAALSAEGWTVTSDDGVLLEERGEVLHAVPAYPGLRLWPDALDATGLRERSVGEVADYSAKVRVAPAVHEPGEGTAPLRHVYVLQRGRGIAVTPLAPRDASAAIFAHLYRADLTDRAALAAQFEACARFVERVPVSRLTLAGTLDSVRDAARALDAHARVGNRRA
jgi:hypothetical protein